MKKQIEKLINLTEPALLNYCKQRLENCGYMVEATSDYVYAVHPNPNPVCLVAHLDTVWEERDGQRKTILQDKEYGILWSVPGGAGFDDRLGVWAIFEILKNCETSFPSVLFTTKEEVGGIGAYAFCEEMPNLLTTTSCFIELDRQGYNEAVFYECNNEAFKDLIKEFGFNIKLGSFSDISILAPHYDIACVNLSIGYVNEHTELEMVFISAVHNTINKVLNIITYFNTSNEVYKWEGHKYDKHICLW